MANRVFEISSFNLRSASDHEYSCLNTFKNILRREILPEDPPVPCSEDTKRWTTMPKYQKEGAWVAWEDHRDKILAYGVIFIWETGDNEHLAEFYIEVLPEYRRQGMGREMLGRAAEFARRHGRRLLQSNSNDRVPASEAFLTAIGARQGLVARTNQLRLSELDRGLIKSWMEKSNRLRDPFEIGLWTAAYPEEQLAPISHLMEELTKDEPHDDLELEDFKFSPEILRQNEENIFATGTKRWTAFIVNRADHQLVGLTEVYWNANRPKVLNQGFTGVLPAFRNQGLGRWLKAEMLTRVLREWPELEVIRTGNANSNAPMLKINNQMGFKPFIARAFWQVDVEAVEGYLSARTESNIKLPAH